MEHGHLGLLISISCCQLLSQQILFDSLLLTPPIILSGLPASPCNIASMQQCNVASIFHVMIALIFQILPCSIASIFYVTDPLDCRSLFDTLSEFFWTVLLWLAMLSHQCDYMVYLRGLTRRLGQKQTHDAKGQIEHPKGPNKFGNNVSDWATHAYQQQTSCQVMKIVSHH